MAKFEKAKVNFFRIRAEWDFIVFLQKNSENEKIGIYNGFGPHAFWLHGQGFGAIPP